MVQALFQGFAPLLTHDPEPLTAADPEAYFWLRHARRADGPVVDLHAGNGRIACVLADQQIEVVAIEPDPRRLAAGRRRTAGLSVTWSPGPLERVDLPRAPALIIVAGRLFQRLLTVGEQRAFLARQYQRLAVGGTLILTLWAPDLPLLASLRGQLHILPVGIGPLGQSGPGRETAAATVDRLGRWLTLHYACESIDGSESVVQRQLSSVQLALVWPREGEHLLVRSGFEIEASYGDWSGAPLTDTVGDQIWVVRKPAG